VFASKTPLLQVLMFTRQQPISLSVIKGWKALLTKMARTFRFSKQPKKNLQHTRRLLAFGIVHRQFLSNNRWKKLLIGRDVQNQPAQQRLLQNSARVYAAFQALAQARRDEPSGSLLLLQESSRMICLSSSSSASHRLHGNMYFCCVDSSTTSTYSRCQPVEDGIKGKNR